MHVIINMDENTSVSNSKIRFTPQELHDPWREFQLMFSNEIYENYLAMIV